ncbi:MAG: thiosulfate oxidation carrier protein SoxY [Paracoccaceae bacterium]|nr:thiosulfate oxidation carrier protein SoxY [Paracoccaceae bacterium]
MELTRRNMLTMGSAALAAYGLGALPAFASLTDDEIAKITGGAETAAGELTITAPEIAENGNTVPISISAPGAVMVAIFAEGNPVPNVATFNFGPLNPTRSASTRIRLATTQNVVAIAKMEDGSFQRASAEVKVTIGGCGG